MARIQGTGIVAAGKEARAKALAKSKQVTSDKKILLNIKLILLTKYLEILIKVLIEYSQESTGGTKERGRGMVIPLILQRFFG